jgi:hypothetical protein
VGLGPGTTVATLRWMEGSVSTAEGRRSYGRGLWQALGGFGWGLFLVVTPLQFVILFWFLWIPAFGVFEFLRICRRGFLPGTPIRLVIIGTTVLAAWYVPMKAEHTRVGPVPRVETNLGELQFFGVIHLVPDSSTASLQVRLPSVTPTRAELEEAIRRQTGLSTDSTRCGTDANILFGAWAGRINVGDERTAIQ